MTAVVVLTLTPEQLRDLVRQAVRDEWRATTETAPGAADWIGGVDAAAMLGVKVDSLRKMRGLPFHRVGRRRRYRRAELEAWIRSGRVSLDPLNPVMQDETRGR